MGYEDVYKIPKGTYSAGHGSLGLIHPEGNTVSWETCRDRFHSQTEYHQNVMSFLFNHSGKQEDVIEFLRTVEQIIRLPAEHALQFRKTDNAHILHIAMSPWWRYRVRRSLLTALCRCGQAYKDRTGTAFEKALWSVPYTNSTKNAITRFLSGYTACKLSKKKYNFSGWQNLFVGDKKETADYVLVRNKKKTKKEQQEEAAKAADQKLDEAAAKKETAGKKASK